MGNTVTIMDNEYKSLDFDSYTKNQIIEYIKKMEIITLNTNCDEYKQLNESLNTTNDKTIPMNIEIYEMFKHKLPIYQQTTDTKTFKYNKNNFIKPQFSLDDVEKKYNNLPNVSYNFVDLGNIELASTNFDVNKITINEFNQSFKVSEDKKDMLGINKKLLHNLSDYIKQKFINNFNTMFNNLDSNVSDYSIGRVSYVYKESKGGPKNDIDSYRQIVALPNIVNQFHRIIALRINEYLLKNNFININIQKGGLSGQSFGILQQIYKLKTVLKDAQKNSKSLCVAFLDITDAYGTLDRKCMSEVLRKYQYPEHFINYINKFYDTLEYYTVVNKQTSRIYKWKNGIIQGCPISPILFVTVMNYILQYINNKYHNECGYKVNNGSILLMAYIDDLCIVGNNVKSVEKVYTELTNILKEYGLMINKNKCGLMVNNYCIDATTTIMNDIPRLNVYKYLGEYLTVNGDVYESYTRFLSMLGKKIYNINMKKISNTEKSELFIKFVLPWMQFHLTNMYDLNKGQKFTIINIVNKYLVEWGYTDNLNLFTNVNEILSQVNDEFINNVNRDDYIDNNLQENIDISEYVIKSVDIKNYNYSNLNEEAFVDLTDII